MLVRILTLQRLALVALMAATTGCSDRTSSLPAAGGELRATVLTIRMTVQPENRTFDHPLIIAGPRARFLGEGDTWRLFNTQERTVTFVDDVEKTYRREPMAEILAKRTKANAAALSPSVPRARIEEKGERQTLHGIGASRTAIESGRYQRDLWMAGHPAVPDELFAMMYLSEPVTSPLAPMMRDVDEAIAGMRGFPLLDRTTVPMGGGTLLVERRVITIAPQRVEAALLTVPRDYRDLTPPPPAEKKAE